MFAGTAFARTSGRSTFSATAGATLLGTLRSALWSALSTLSALAAGMTQLFELLGLFGREDFFKLGLCFSFEVGELLLLIFRELQFFRCAGWQKVGAGVSATAAGRWRLSAGGLSGEEAGRCAHGEHEQDEFCFHVVLFVLFMVLPLGEIYFKGTPLVSLCSGFAFGPSRRALASGRAGVSWCFTAFERAVGLLAKSSADVGLEFLFQLRGNVGLFFAEVAFLAEILREIK